MRIPIKITSNEMLDMAMWWATDHNDPVQDLMDTAFFYGSKRFNEIMQHSYNWMNGPDWSNVERCANFDNWMWFCLLLSAQLEYDFMDRYKKHCLIA